MHASKTLAALGAAGLVALAGARPAGAQSLPFGGRTAAMGGTGIARGDDSAMPLLNPAGLALVPHSTLSISASLYAFHHVDVPGFNADSDTILSPRGSIEISQRGLASNTIESLPTSLAGMLHLPGAVHQVLALSVTIPRSTSRRFVQNLDLALKDPMGRTGYVFRDALTFVENTAQYVAGLSYGVALQDRLRVGATLGINYAPSLINSRLKRLSLPSNASDFELRNDDYTRDSYSVDLNGIFGAQLDVTDRISVGATFQTPALHLTGSWEVAQDTEISDPNAMAPAVTSSIHKLREDGDAIDAPPMKLGVGVSFRQPDRWSIGLDAHASIAIKNDRRIKATRVISSIRSGEAPTVAIVELDEERRRLNRFNGSIGGEVKVGAETWLRLGAFTDLSLDPALAGNPNRDQVLAFPFNRFGATAGIGTVTGPVDSTIGIAVSYGAGETGRLDPLRQEMAGRIGIQRTDARLFDFMFYITGAVDLKKAAGGIGGKMGGG